MTVPTPTPRDIALPQGPAPVVAFYYPGRNTPWDDLFQGPFMGNFWPCQVTLAHNGLTGHFHVAEAAFQCTKWWNAAGIQTFEACQTGHEAFDTSRTLTRADYGYAGLGRVGAMEAVLAAKFQDPTLKAALLATGDAYLLEHSARKKGAAHPHQDDFWCDNHDGTGTNQLGKCLMALRAQLGGTGDPLPAVPLPEISGGVLALLARSAGGVNLAGRLPLTGQPGLRPTRPPIPRQPLVRPWDCGGVWGTGREKGVFLDPRRPGPHARHPKRPGRASGDGVRADRALSIQPHRRRFSHPPV